MWITISNANRMDQISIAAEYQVLRIIHRSRKKRSSTANQVVTEASEILHTIFGLCQKNFPTDLLTHIV